MEICLRANGILYYMGLENAQRNNGKKRQTKNVKIWKMCFQHRRVCPQFNIYSNVVRGSCKCIGVTYCVGLTNEK